MRRVRRHRAGHQVAHHDARGPALVDHHVEHLAAGVQLHGPGLHLPGHRLVGAEEQLLAGLAPGVEGARHLGAAERPVVEQAPVLPGEGNPLGGALVDDLVGHLGQPVDVGLPGPVVAALDGVVEQPEHAVAVVAVVLGGVDAALGGDGVGSAGRVVEGEHLHPIAELAEGGGRRGAGQSGADDDDLVLPLVGRVDQPGGEAVPVPLLGERAPAGPWRPGSGSCPGGWPAAAPVIAMTPSWMAMGTAANPAVTMTANTGGERCARSVEPWVVDPQALEEAPGAVPDVQRQGAQRHQVEEEHRPP